MIGNVSLGSDRPDDLAIHNRTCESNVPATNLSHDLKSSRQDRGDTTAWSRSRLRGDP